MNALITLWRNVFAESSIFVSASAMVQTLNCPSTSGGSAMPCSWAVVAKLIPFFNGSFAGGFLTRRSCA